MIDAGSELGLAIGAETPVVLDLRDLPETFCERVRKAISQGFTREEAVASVIMQQTTIAERLGPTP